MSHVPEVLVTALALVLLVSLAGAAVLYLLWYYERQSGYCSQPLPGATAGTLNPASWHSRLTMSNRDLAITSGAGGSSSEV